MRPSLTGIGLLSGILLVSLGTGCQNKLHDENLALHRQNTELQRDLDEARMRLGQAPDPGRIGQLEGEIAQRDAKISDLQQQLAKPAPNTPPEESNLLSGIEVTRDPTAGTMTVNLPGDVLFASGSADLKQSAKSTLDKVIAAVKKDYANKKVLVRGYTDTDPISKSKDKWEDNLDLSAARARTVAKYLTMQGLSTKNVGLQAFGETVPRGSKDKSRRVEIVVATR